MRRPGQLLLNAVEIERTIFVDYEGSKNKPPTLLGYMIDSEIGGAIIERPWAVDYFISQGYILSQNLNAGSLHAEQCRRFHACFERCGYVFPPRSN
jgi:hypothetical protein